ncbi:MAG: hypothetical protein QG670_1739 [Thermoproteota archaeon]|nr:hypothetical protein [Thermoproteota archaeon]
MRTVTEPERKTPVLANVDVAIVGGGPAGFVAALAAKQVGADTLLIERYGYLGGLLTGGFVTKPQAPIVGGLLKRFLSVQENSVVLEVMLDTGFTTGPTLPLCHLWILKRLSELHLKCSRRKV